MKSGNLLEKETAGVNQILPHKHKWAWELYEQAIKKFNDIFHLVKLSDLNEVFKPISRPQRGE